MIMSEEVEQQQLQQQQYSYYFNENNQMSIIIFFIGYVFGILSILLFNYIIHNKKKNQMSNSNNNNNNDNNRTNNNTNNNSDSYDDYYELMNDNNNNNDDNNTTTNNNENITTTTTSRCTSLKKDDDRTHAGAIMEGDELSLFYDTDVNQLTTIHNSAKYISNELYQQLVLNTVVCCIDILLIDTVTKQALIVRRTTNPIKGYWWLPGGRIMKGETFYTAAVRKIRGEVGIDDNIDIKPIQILGTYNTFFPTSHWDTKEQQGTQTINTVVLMECTKGKPKIYLDPTSDQYKWISIDPMDHSDNKLDPYILQQLLRLRTWNPNYIHYKSK